MTRQRYLESSFLGTNLKNTLTREKTVCEYDGTIDSAGKLIDISSVKFPLKNNHNLNPSATAPTSIVSSIQDYNGNRLIARNFTSASFQTYSKSTHADFNIFTGAWTITMILAPSASGSGINDLFDKINGNDGVWLAINTSHQVRIRLYNGTDYTEVSNTAVTVRDGYYHIVQIVRTGNLVTVYVDGTAGTTTTVRSADGSNNSGSIYLWGAGGAYYDGTGLYFRLDSEALSQERLIQEQNILLGIGANNSYAGKWSFSRSSTAYQTYSDGTMSLRYNNIPRISGEGKGVLIEDSRTNLLTYSQEFDNGAWTPNSYASITANSAIAPDGTQTADTLLETGSGGGGNATDYHYIQQAPAISNGSVYTFSVFVKAGLRSWVRVFESQSGVAVYANVSTGYIGTTAGTPIATKMENYGNGWYRISVTNTINYATYSATIGIAEADNDPQFEGTSAPNNTALYIWGAQVELGYHPTSYYPTTSSAATRSADSIVINPCRYEKTALNLGSEMMYIDFTQDATNAAITSNTGGYTFTRTNAINRKYELSKGGYYHEFVSANSSRYSLSDSGPSVWTPTKSFAFVVLVTPTSLPTGSPSYMYVFNKWNITGNQRCWGLYYNDTGDWIFSTSYDGTTLTSAQKNASVVIGKTQLIIANFAYSGAGTTGTSTLYVDNTSVATKINAYMANPNSTAAVRIGCSGAGSSYFDGKIHYVSFFSINDNVGLTSDQITLIQSQYKKGGLLPLSLSASTHYKKLYISFDAKCLYSSTTDIGGISRTFVEIGGNNATTNPTATSNKNRISITTQSSGKIRASFWSNGSTTERYIESAAYTDLNQWHTYKFYLDLSELTNSTFYRDGTQITTTVSMGTNTTAQVFNTDSTFIRLGNNYASTVDGNVQIKNFRIYPEN